MIPIFNLASVEAKLKGLIGAKFCLGVSSGTDALLISLMALGVKKGEASKMIELEFSLEVVP